MARKLRVTVLVDGIECDYPQGVFGYAGIVVTVSEANTGDVIIVHEPPNLLEYDEETTFVFEVPDR